jgi:hypothetical protein
MLKTARLLAFAVALLAPVSLSTSALGAECIGVTVPDSAKVGSADLVLNGLGIRKATMLSVKVYVAGLYLPEKSTDADAILGADRPWRLVLRFVRDVGASDIRDALDEGFENTVPDKLDALQSRIDALNAQVVDFKEGQYLSYDYDPAQGTVIDVNGKTGNPIEGADFANALLAISIGPEPPNEDLKTGLLGGKCE